MGWTLAHAATLAELDERCAATPPQIEACEEALAAAEAQPEPKGPAVAARSNALGMALQRLDRYAEAAPLHRRALTLALPWSEGSETEKALGDLSRALGVAERSHTPSDVVPQILGQTANVAIDAGRPAEAVPLLRRAIALVEHSRGEEDTLVGRHLVSLSRALRAAERFEEAIAALGRAVAIEELQDPPLSGRLARHLRTLAQLVEETGDLHRAEGLLRRSLDVAENAFGTDHPQLLTTLGNLGDLLVSQGSSVEAEMVLRRALQLAHTQVGPDSAAAGRAAGRLGRLLHSIGRYDEALARLEQSRDALATHAPGSPNMAVVLYNLATLREGMGDHGAAKDLLQQALLLLEQAHGPQHSSVGRVLAAQASLLRAEGRTAEALELFARARRIVEAAVGTDHRSHTNVISSMAAAHYDLGQFDAAEDLLSSALASRERMAMADHPDTAVLHRNLAMVHGRRGALQEALASTVRAVEIQEQYLARNLVIGTPEERRQNLAQFAESRWQLMSLHLRALPHHEGASRAALQTVLRQKGRLLDVEHDIVQQVRNEGDEEGLALVSALAAEVTALGALRHHNPSEEDIEAFKEAITQRTSEIDALQRKLAARSAAFEDSTRSVMVDDVAAALPHNAALLELAAFVPFDVDAGRFLDTPEVAAYVLRPDGRITARSLGTKEALDQQVLALREAILDKDPVGEAAQAAWEGVLAPLADALEGVRHLFVAADGVANLLPFEVLLQRSERRSLQRMRISYLTSGSDLLRRGPAEVPSGAPVVIYDVDYGPASAGGPAWSALPGAVREGRRVRDVVRGVSLTGSKATEDAFRQLERPRWLHVATHGFFEASLDPLLYEDVRGGRALGEPDGPSHRPLPEGLTWSGPGSSPMLRSGVVLAGANLGVQGETDGLLTAAEIANLDLRGTDLVVLSACETGVGEVRNGDGVHGLRRALVLAGSRAQILSLWKVSDKATAALMTEFYDGLGSGRSVAVAFAHAQERIRKKPKWKHPFYWAAFTVSGDPDVSR